MKSVIYAAVCYAAAVYLLGWTKFGDRLQGDITDAACWAEESLALRGYFIG